MFSEALTTKELDLKGVKAQISGTKQEIVRCQERHDHLTTVEQRVERICSNRKIQIRQTEELIRTTRADTEKASRAKQATLKTLEETTEEVKAADRDIREAQVRVQALDGETKALEEQVLLLLRERVTAEKSGEYTDR